MTKRGRISGDSYFVVREEPERAPIMGRATSAERANRLAAKYRYLPAAQGTTVTVTASTDSRWVPWVYSRKSWVREGTSR